MRVIFRLCSQLGVISIGLVLALSPPSCVLAPRLTPSSVSDITPDVNDSAGATLDIVGDGKVMYAVPFAAGVWRWTHSPSEEGNWQQLPNSPAHAYSIAVDPADVRHVAVGERDGDAANPNANKSGVWESFDGGESWPKYFDPRSNSSCLSQAVPSVAFTSRSTLLAGTTCGLAVKHGGRWFFPSTPFDAEFITGITASQTKAWARDAAGNLIVSSDDGVTWASPGTARRPTDRGQDPSSDQWTLAATDAYAVEIVVGDAVDDNHFTAYYIYDVASDRWAFHQYIHDQSDPPGRTVYSVNRTGSPPGHSRRFVNTYRVARGAAPSWFLGDGQRVFRSVGFDASTLEFTWQNILNSDAAEITHQLPIPYQHMCHSELWDFFVTPDGKSMWATTDGGVWRNDVGLNSFGWHSYNPGLHTYHAHQVWADDNASRIAFVTQDNSARRQDASHNWVERDPKTSADVNFVYGDVNRDGAFVVLGKFPVQAGIDGFGSAIGDVEAPAADYVDIAIVNGPAWAGSPWFWNQERNYFAVIRTKAREFSPDSPLDVVLFSPMPFRNGSGVILLNNGQSSAILRNQRWAEHPDINTSSGQGWSIFADNIPSDAHGLQIGGGHRTPVLYVYGDDAIYRADGKVPTTWTRLPVLGDGVSAQLLSGSASGPVFVNPLAPNVLYALTAKGVRVSHDSGNTWSTDWLLTALITGDSRYPLTGHFVGQNVANVGPWIKNGGNFLATLSSMGFDRQAPENIGAASPFTGVFVKNGTETWTDVSDSLPKPRTAVSGVARSGNQILVSMEGRGVVQLTLPCMPRRSCSGPQQCGVQDDGCGGSVSCGICGWGTYCEDTSNRCIVPGTDCKADCRHEHECDEIEDPVFRRGCIQALRACLAACGKRNAAGIWPHFRISQ